MTVNRGRSPGSNRKGKSQMVRIVSTRGVPGEAMGSDCYGWAAAMGERDEDEEEVFNAWLAKQLKESGKSQEEIARQVKKAKPQGLRGGKKLL